MGKPITVDMMNERFMKTAKLLGVDHYIVDIAAIYFNNNTYSFQVFFIFEIDKIDSKMEENILFLSCFFNKIGEIDKENYYD